MTRRRISASTPYQATLQSSDRIVMTRKSATAVRAVLPAAAALAQADCHGHVWSRVTTGWSPISASPDDAPTSRDDAHAMVAPIDELAPDTMETAEQEKSAGVDKKDLLFRQPPSRHRIVLESVALTFDVPPRRDPNEPLSPLDFLSISRS
ncbi:hypothetical protein [Cereibacter johrii]|uniref:hypothetical protein n=1 Tax=Cereibacter johrii TaxID=445629 RepID=UPI000DCF5958|nr:hypothetical protein [Cereibacter johrii]RAZ81744.1 hypothetical protein DDV93_22400 [Cereibacter johrii]